MVMLVVVGSCFDIMKETYSLGGSARLNPNKCCNMAATRYLATPEKARLGYPLHAL